jgi:4'-phosphopantetheinyl transferase EntD
VVVTDDAEPASRAPAAGALRDPWVGDLFGADVLTGSLAIDAADPAALRPEEAALAARFAPSRLREFAAGRLCARPLLAALGAGDPLLLVGAHRAPAWPPNVVGSLSHGAGLCVVALARRDAFRGLGVDVESEAPLGEAVRRRVCTDGEARLLAGADAADAGRLAKLLFSAKEAVYKCVHPLLERPLGLRSVEIRLDTEAGRFCARALEAAGEGAAALVDAVEGAWALRAGRVLTGATLRAPGSAGASVDGAGDA